jgi:hypothetical protein
MSIRLANIAEMFERGQQASQEQRKARTLRDFLQPAMSGDPNALGALHRAGAHQEALGAQNHVAGQQKAAQDAQMASRDDFGKLSVAMTQMAGTPQAQQVFAQWLKAGKASGLLPAEAPEQYDPEAHKAAEHFAKAFGGAKAPEPFTLSPGSKRFGADGQVIAEVPFAPQKRQLVKVPDGQGGTIQMEYDGQNLYPPNYGGAPQAAGPSGGASTLMDGAYQGAAVDPVADFPQMISGFDNAQVSSLHRTPEHNAKVGGVGNSFHTKGQAMDLAGLTPQQVAELRQRSGGRYDVLDEGDHVHVEPARGVQARSGFGPGARLGYTPPKQNSPKVPSGYRMAADGLSLEPIPGGPAQVAIDARADAAAASKAAQEVKEAQKRQQNNARQMESVTAATQLVSAIDDLTRSGGFDDLGTVWGDMQLRTPLVRNEAKDAQAQLKNIAGQVALATMSRLKALSAQGATGFGALSAPELKLLENSIATLQSEDISNAQLQKSLKTIRDAMAKVADWKPQGAPSQPGGWAIQRVD